LILLPFVFAFTVIVIGIAFWVAVPFGLQTMIDTTSIPSNNTIISGELPSNYNISLWIVDGHIIMAKIPLQNVPTVINGITTSTSIIVGFTGTIIGIMVREIFKDDKKMRNALQYVSIFIGLTFAYLFLVYYFVVGGLLEMALRTALIGFLFTLLLFFLVMSLGVYRMAKNEENEKGTKVESESEKKGSENKDNGHDKTVNIFINVS